MSTVDMESPEPHALTTLRSATRLVSKIGVILLPSFLVKSSISTHNHTKKNIRSTAWLDGLRGWASFVVFIYHYNNNYNSWNQRGYGYQNNYVVLTLPIIRSILAGSGMVSLFFVVSGYSLALGPLKELHRGDMPKFYNRLASSTLRRAIRLYASPVACSFLVAMCIQLGLFNYSAAHYPGFNRIAGPASLPPIMPTMMQQIYHWFQATKEFLVVLRFNINHGDVFIYIPPSWTITVEFLTSMVLFLSMMAVSHLKYWSRNVVYAAILAYSFVYAQWAILLFHAGYMLAEHDLYRDATSASITMSDVEPEKEIQSIEICSSSPVLMPNKVFRNGRHHKVMRLALFVLGLHLISAPDFGQDSTFPYDFFYNHISPKWWPGDPRARFSNVVGSIVIVYSVSKCAPLQRFFGNPLSCYLGRISYAIYLWHQSINSMVGFWIVPNLWKITDGLKQPAEPSGIHNPGRPYAGTNWIGFESGVFLGWVFVAVVTVWIADVFTRLVDEPIVRLARRTELIMVRAS